MSEECKGIFEAMANVMRDIEAVGKTKKVQGGGMNYNFRGIDDVYNAAHDLMGKHGIFCLPILEKRESQMAGNSEIAYVEMVYRFCHKDGSHVECRTVGEGMDRSDKAFNKAMSMAHKYALLQVFCIPTEDMQEADRVYEDRQTAVNSSQRQAPKPAISPLRREFYNYLSRVYDGNKSRILSDLRDFFGKSIQSSIELSEEEIGVYMRAVKENQSDGQEEEEF